MSKQVIYTIGRQYGSDGRAVGEALAKQLGIPFYDRELLAEVSKDSAYAVEVLDSFDEKPMRSLLYSMAMGQSGGMMNAEMPLSMQAFLAQLQTIQRLADENGSCVFVGRCADYALRDRTNVVSVFVTSEKEARIKTVMERDGVSEEKAQAMMRRIDKNRASYYNYYTEQRWGTAENYDLCINSARLGVEGTAQYIAQFGEKIV